MRPTAQPSRALPAAPEAPQGTPTRREAPPAPYPPEHVHETKKLIAARLGKADVRAVNRRIDQTDDPLPVRWCRRRNTWIISEADIAAWAARQAVPAGEAKRMGLIPKRCKAAGEALSQPEAPAGDSRPGRPAA